MRAMRILPAMIGLTVLCVLTVPVQAAVYKWTDADGVVRYGQLPPPGVQAQTIRSANAEAAPAEATGAAKPAPQTQDEAQLEKIRAEQATREAKRKAEADAYCAQARAALQKFNENPPHRLTSLDANGEQVRMSQADYDSRRAQVETGIKEHCN